MECKTFKRIGRKRVAKQIRHCISFRNLNIWNSPNVNFLGIKFNSSLDWGPHVQTVLLKYLTPMKIINCLRHTWGADPILLMNLYRSLIRFRIDYGIFLLHGLKKSQSLLLDRLQWRAIRLAFGCRVSTPTNVLLSEACEAPIHLRTTFLCLNFLIRACLNSNHPLIESLRGIKDSLDSPVTINPLVNLILISCYLMRN